MKRSQLVEYGIIVIALIAGYKFFESVFSLVVQLVYDFQRDREIGSFAIPYLLMVILYFASFILLIRRSRQIAVYLARDQDNETVPLKMNKKSLLQVILIAICVLTILSNITTIILYLFDTFKHEVSKRSDPFGPNEIEKLGFKTAAIQTIIALVILYFSKDISHWFIKKNDTEELILESEAEK
ncbi:MAG: hypothetical protein JNK27_10785 [Chitinophagaceae bacterium]|nr:hypothetical protein [Chitinophagaceae bacterium]